MRNTVFKFCVFIIFMMVLFFFPIDTTHYPAALAKTPSKTPQNDDTEQVKIKKDDVVQFLETLEIFGRVEKPQTVFIIPGKDPTVEDNAIKRRFFKEIFRTVEKPTLSSKKHKSDDTPYIPY